MMKTLTRQGAAILAITVLSGTAIANGQIKDDAEIFHRLLTAAVGNEIRDNCPTIEVRTIAATFYVIGIVNYASAQGFSRAEMDAFREDPKEQDRLRKAAHAYLDSHGVNRKDAASYCPLGKAEIEQKSEIGRLLKSR